MERDANGLVVLDRAECVSLLARHSFGRIALTVDALPLVLPVSYVFDGSAIVVRTNAGAKLAAATRHAVVAFEVDEVDPLYHSGWSVVVQGVARNVDDPAEIERLHRLRLPTWTPIATSSYVIVSPDIVTGRRIPRPHGEATPTAAATMVG